MAWTVRLKESVIQDLRWFGRRDGRMILKKAEEVLSSYSPSIMKIIPLSEAKTNLSRYAKLCHKEPVIVTINGVPAFQLVPLEEDDDLVDRLIEHHPQFRKLLEKRLGEKTVLARDASRKL